MVTTRRKAANAVAATTDSNTKPMSMHFANGTNRIVYTNKNIVNTVAPTLKSSISIYTTTPPDSISEHNLSLTSPPPSRTSSDPIMNPPGHDVQNLVQHDPGPVPIRQILAPKPHGIAGSVNNPISMLEDSPPKMSAHTPTISTKRKYQQQQQLLEPHKFVDKGYRKLYSYRQSRPAVVPQPAHGTTFTGHKSQDVYRAINAKVTAVTGTKPSRVPVPVKQVVPFEVQFPMSAHFLANRAVTNPMFASFIHQHGIQVPAAIQFPAQSEALLRKKAIQYVREYSRPELRKRALSKIDPDETSISESEEPLVGLRKTPTSSTPQAEIASTTPRFSVLSTPKLSSTPQPASSSNKTMSTPVIGSYAKTRLTTRSAPASAPVLLSTRQKGKLPVFRDTPQNAATTQVQVQAANTTDITELTEHTILLTSLLQLYPTSRDKPGLREDIAMLVSVQNQRFEAWQKSETDAAQKTLMITKKKNERTIKSSSVDAPISTSAYKRPYTGRSTLLKKRQHVQSQTVEQARATKMDSQIRGFLSAGAGMWQDGSGVGVADVFAGREGTDGGLEEGQGDKEEEEEEEERPRVEQTVGQDDHNVCPSAGHAMEHPTSP